MNAAASFAPLPPVELIYFYPELHPDGVLLKWGTATEVSNFGFFVHKSDGIPLNFYEIGFVEGNGNSHSPKHYTFLDTAVTLDRTYYYRLKQVDFDGTFEYSDTVSITFTTSVEKIEGNLPSSYLLHQNYPNPFNPVTTIKFEIPGPSFVEITITDNLGKIISVPVSEYLSSGSYKIIYNAGGLSSGVYFYSIKTRNFFSTRKFILIK